jgi:hypothetical protein
VGTAHLRPPVLKCSASAFAHPTQQRYNPNTAMTAAG